MKKKKNTKRENQRLHFEKRCLERIGKLLDRKEIIRKIQWNLLEFINKESNRVTVWKYEYAGKYYKVFYDKQRKQVITIYQI